MVQQLAYTAWPDHGVPNETKELLLLRTAVRQAMRDGDSAGAAPIVVHCSAGVGRTGTFIAVDRCIEQCLDVGGEGHELLDIDEVCTVMRLARNQMVQTEEQYMCIHSALLDAVTWLIEAANGAQDEVSHSTPGYALTQATLIDPDHDQAQAQQASEYEASASQPGRKITSRVPDPSVRRENPVYISDAPTDTQTASLRKSSTLRLNDGDALGDSSEPGGQNDSPRALSFVRGSSQRRAKTSTVYVAENERHSTAIADMVADTSFEQTLEA